MALCLKLIIPFLSVLITAQYGGAFVTRRQVERIRIHLGEEDALVLPNYLGVRSVKVVYPVTSNKFYSELSKINKKPSKQVKHHGKLVSSLLVTDEEPVSPEWPTLHLDAKEEPPFEEIREHEGIVGTPHVHLDENFEEIKPVTELIKDDLKYDFRTKTHSI